MSTRHYWADIFIVRRQGPDGLKGSTMKSTATCSTRRGMGSVRLYFAQDSQCYDNKQPYHTGSVAARVNKDLAFRAWAVLWQYETKMTGTSGRGSLVLAFLAFLRCSAGTVLWSSHVVESLRMEGRHLARSSALCSRVSRLMPNAFTGIFRESLNRFFWPP